MFQKKSLYYALPAILLSTLLVVAVIWAWTEPGAIPPGGNVWAPINIGNIDQTKDAGISVASLTSRGGAVLARDIGSVSIGTTSTVGALTVRRSAAGNALAIRNTGNTDNTFTVSDTGFAHMTGFRLGASATAGHVLTTNVNGVGTWQAPQGDSLWHFNPPNTLHPITNDYNVGIGTMTANEKLEVGGNIRLLGDLWFRDANRYMGTQTNHNLYLRTNNTDRITILNNGDVGIGTTAPGEKLDVNGNIRASAFFYSSDISLKEDIKPLENSLVKILQLNGISYQMKETGQERLGFSAQEVAKVFPEVVSQDQNGLLSMESSGLIAALVEAVKTQQAQINELKAEIEQLKNQ